MPAADQSPRHPRAVHADRRADGLAGGRSTGSGRLRLLRSWDSYQDACDAARAAARVVGSCALRLDLPVSPDPDAWLGAGQATEPARTGGPRWQVVPRRVSPRGLARLRQAAMPRPAPAVDLSPADADVVRDLIDQARAATASSRATAARADELAERCRSIEAEARSLVWRLRGAARG